MNKPVWLARLLTLGAFWKPWPGWGFSLTPRAGIGPLWVFDRRAGIAIGRIGGGGLLSLGIACWLARKTPTAPASVGVAWAYLAYNVVTCVTLAWASVALGGGSLPALGASVLHGAIGAAVLGALLGRGKTPVGHDLGSGVPM